MAQTRKTASKNDTSEAIDALGVIVGDIYSNIEIISTFIDDISTELNSSTISQTITNSIANTEYLKTTANMLTAIAGYLFGDKGATLSTDASSFLGKIKNNEPILGAVSPDTLAEMHEEDSAQATLKLIVEGVDGDTFDAMTKLMEALQDIFGDEPFLDNDVIIDAIETLNEMCKAMSKIKFDKIDDSMITGAQSLNTCVSEFNTIYKSLSRGIIQFVLVNALKEQILAAPKVLAELISGTNGKGGFVMVMNHYKKFEDLGQNIQTLGDFVDSIKKIFMGLAIAGLISTIAVKLADNIPAALEKIKDTISKLNEIEIGEITCNIDNIKKAAELIDSLKTIFIGLTICGIFAIPGMVGALLLLVATKIIVKLLKSISETLDVLNSMPEAQANIKNLALILLVMGITMLVAALVGGFVLEHAGEILGFLGVFMLFTVGILIAVGIGDLFMGDATMAYAQNLCILVATFAVVMMIGALFMLLGLEEQIISFAVLFVGFIFGLIIPIVILHLATKNMAENALRDFAIFVGVCALTMMLGAVFMLSGLWKEALKFGGILMVFMGMMLLPLGIFAAFMKKNKGKKGRGKVAGISGNDDSIAAEFAIFMGTCVVALLIGALVVHFGLGAEALIFGAILAAFIVAVVAPFGIWGKKIQKAKAPMIVLCVLIGVATIALILGAAFIEKYGADSTIIFATVLSIMVAILGAMLYALSKLQKEVYKGAIAMGVIAGVILVASGGMLLLGKSFKEFGDWKNALVMVGILSALILAVGAMTVAAGALMAGPQALFFLAGVAAMAIISGVIITVSVAVLLIAKAYKMTMEATGGKTPDLGIMRTLLFGFIRIVKDVGKYGRKIKFGAVMKVAISCLALAAAISAIGKAVAEFANLRVADKYDNKGNPISFRQLKDSDFKNAATGIKKIVKTLGKAVIDIYEENPAMFVQPGLAGFFGCGDTIFTKVVKSVTGLGKMISSIAKGVATMANLKVAEKWDKEGNPISFRQLGKKDFTNAARNISKIVSVLGAAVIKIYDDHPYMFAQPGLMGVFGFGDTVFDKVVKSVGGMGEMIKNIATGVGDMAALKVATKWDKKGNPTKYRQLGKKDFESANENISKIVSVLGAAVIKIYNDHPYMFAEPGLLGLFGCGETVFDKVTRSVGGLGVMIKNIATGVADMANLTVATEWDKKGNPKKYRQLGDTDFESASTNISKIVSVLGGAVSRIYRENPKMFAEPGIGSWFGKSGETVFDKVTRSVGGLGKMIASIATGVSDMANLKVATEWDRQGNPKKYRQLTDQDFESANTNIGKIVRELGKDVTDIYHNNKELFEVPPVEVKIGFIKIKKAGSGKTVFQKVTESCATLGTMISGIAKGVADMASMKVVDEWDNEGNPKKYRKLTDTDFESANRNIGLIITSLGSAINNIYNTNRSLFDVPPVVTTSGWGPWKKTVVKPGSGETTFQKVVNSCSGLGSMISGIASGVRDMASMKVPSAFDSNGNPTAFEKLGDSHFDAASTNISKIISTLGGAIISLYDEKPWMFWGGSNNIFSRVLDSSIKLGTMISSISRGVQTFAASKVPVKWDKNGNPIEFEHLGTEEYKKASDTIKDIITSLSNALISVYNENPEMFDGATSFWELIKGKSIPPIYKVMGASLQMGRVLATIAFGVSCWGGDGSKVKVPIEYSKEGKPIKYQMVKVNPAKLTETLKNVIFPLFDAVKSLYAGEYKEIFDAEWTFSLFGRLTKKNPIQKVIYAVNQLSGMLVKTAEGIGKMCKDVKKDADGTRLANLVTGLFSPLLSEINWWTFRYDFENIIEKTEYIVELVNDYFADMFETLPDIFKNIQKLAKYENKITESTLSICELPFGALKKMVEKSKDIKPEQVDLVVDICTESLNDIFEELFNIAKKLQRINKGITDAPGIATTAYILGSGLFAALRKMSALTPSLKELETLFTGLSVFIAPIFGSLLGISEGIQNSIKTLNIKEIIIKITELGVGLYTSLSAIYESSISNIKLRILRNGLNKFIIPIYKSLCNIATTVYNAIHDVNTSAFGVQSKKIIEIIYNNVKYINANYKFSNRDLKKMYTMVNSVILPFYKAVIICAKELYILTKLIKNPVLFNYQTEKMISGIFNSVKTAIELWTLSASDSTVKMQIMVNSLKAISKVMSTHAVVLYKTVLNEITDVDKFNDIYLRLINGLMEPFVDMRVSHIQKMRFFDKALNVKKVNGLVKTINSLKVEKVDKFIELSRELRTLNDTVANFDELIDALNGRINDTLTELSTKLDLAAKTIIISDKAQEKRQSLVKQNVRELEKVLKTKMHLEVSSKEVETQEPPVGGEEDDPDGTDKQGSEEAVYKGTSN